MGRGVSWLVWERGGKEEEGGGGCTAAVESHSARAGKVVLFGPDALNGLLGHDVAGCKEYLPTSTRTVSK